MAVARLALTSFADGEVRLSDEVELYQRTYTTLLRSSGETQLRVLESSHRAMGSSLHPLAASEELDLGAFIYAIQPAPRRHRRRAARRDGPGRRGADRERHPGRVLAGGRGPGPPAALVRQRGRDARRAAGQRLGRRRPRADAGGVPDRVEQDPRSDARRRLARRGRHADVPAGGVRARARRQRRGLGAAARRLGRRVRGADAADRRAAAVAAGADARRHAHRLRAPDPALVGAGQRRAGRRRPDRAAALLRQLEHPQPRQHRHRHRARARGRARRASSSSCPRTTSCARS